MCGKISVPAHIQKQDKHKKQEADVHRREQNTTHTHNIPITLQPCVHLHLIYPFQPSEFLTLHPVQHCDGARVAETRNPASKRDSDRWRGVEQTFLEAKKDPGRQNHRFLFRDGKHTHTPIFPTCCFFFRFSILIHICVILSHNASFFISDKKKRQKHRFLLFWFLFFYDNTSCCPI